MLSRPAVVCSLSASGMEVIAAIVFREWYGVVGDSLCNSIWPLCFLCALVPQISVNDAGPSGDARIADSAFQVGGSCEEVHRRNQVRICDSDAPIVDHMLVRRGSPLLSFCLLGLSSMWWRVSASPSICVIVARPPMPYG